MCFCLRGLDAKDKMRDMATHSRLRAHGLIRDSYLIHRYHIDLVKNCNGEPWMDFLERFESMMGREH